MNAKIQIMMDGEERIRHTITEFPFSLNHSLDGVWQPAVNIINFAKRENHASAALFNELRLTRSPFQHRATEKDFQHMLGRLTQMAQEIQKYGYTLGTRS